VQKLRFLPEAHLQLVGLATHCELDNLSHRLSLSVFRPDRFLGFDFGLEKKLNAISYNYIIFLIYAFRPTF
jgi:hypothetical protein